MNIFLRGLIIGISIAAPVGPIGLLCIRRTLAEGRLSGLISGLGAASADAFYGIIAGFGLTFISSYLVAQQFWLNLIGGIFLCYLGIRTLSTKSSSGNTSRQSNSPMGNYLSVFILTLTNPMTILSFAAIFAGLGLVNENGGYISALVMVLGVFMGSTVWWFILSLGVGFFRKQISTKWMTWINWLSGAVIFIFGAWMLFRLAASNSPL